MQESSQIIVSSFYKYVKIDDPGELRQKYFDLCISLGLKGTILIAEEGINGSICGTKNNVAQFKEHLIKNDLFSDLEFKEQETNKVAFKKMFVRVKKEIVNLGLNLSLKNTAKYISPKQLKEMLDKNDDIALVDMRNDYEFRIGKFRNARSLNIETFRQLPQGIKNIEDLKEKKVVAYCTGGIRCEKASAFLIENGFKEVYQLKGGILKYGEEFPDTHWEGKCFVFDERLAVDLNHKSEPLNKCSWCGKKSDDYAQCTNKECDNLFVCCGQCKENHNGCCSEGCVNYTKKEMEIDVLKHE